VSGPLTDQALAETLRQVRAEHGGRVGVQGATDGQRTAAKFFISGQVGKWTVTGYARVAGERGKPLSGDAGAEVSRAFGR
jgi:hypothetical protein